MRDINKKFSVRYYLNLVLVDEEERRYFKQQVGPSFSSVQDGIYALRKARIRSTPSIGSLPNVVLETVPVLV